MLYEFKLNTGRECFVDITAQSSESVRNSGVMDGVCVVFCPHTTAGVTINENADPEVVRDMLIGLDQAFPDRPAFRHAEGNSSAHLKASSVGSSVAVIVHEGRLVLGTWQAIYFCEFDGPRDRKFYVKIMP